MIWGIQNDVRVQAEPQIKDAHCELCNKILIAKCGQIKVWHFAHKSKIECDDWWEGETLWHLNWKKEFPTEQQEIIIGKHRADIKTRTGTIIELQNSSISLNSIQEREKFYGSKMIWLLGNKLTKNLHIGNKGWIWDWEPAINKYSTNPLFVDWGEYIYKINKDKFKSVIRYTRKQFLQIYCDIYKKEEENGNLL